jgi:Bacterial cell division membrane protein
LVLSRDLGTAAIYGVTTLIVFYVATGNLLATGIGIGAGVAGAMAAYTLFSHVRVRVAVWRNPWAKYGEVGGGYQIAQGLMAIASGGLFGMGLGRGMPKSIPAYRTDYIFAVICEEMGILVGVCIIALFLLLILRGFSIARQGNDRFHSLLSVGVVTVFGIQSFLIIGGVVKLIPLTGVTLPFVSYGGSSMIASFILLGMLAYASIQTKK